MPSFLADEGIAQSTIRLIRSHGFTIDSVRDLGLQGSSDEALAGHAIEKDQILLTLDLDFGELYHFVHRGKLIIILVRAYPDAASHINELLDKFLARKDLSKILASPSLIIISNSRTRIIP